MLNTAHVCTEVQTFLQLLHLVAVVLGLAAESQPYGQQGERMHFKKQNRNQIDEMQREKNMRNLVGSYSRRNKLM